MMPDSSPILCVVCGNEGYTVIINNSTNGRQTVRCNSCNLIYVVPIWTAETARETFAQQNKWPGGLSSSNTSNRQPGMRFIARQIAVRLPHGGCLLDVGCADGKFFNIMRQGKPARWQFFGAEPDTKWQGLDYQGAEVSLRPLRECQFQDHQFDVVTILDALYYIPDPDKELAEIVRILKPGGILVFDIAGLGYLQLRGLVGALFGLDRTHTFAAYPFYHSSQSVQLLLTKAGFVIDARLSDQGIEHRLTLLRVAMPVYVSLVKLANLFVPLALDLAPKIVYVARRL